MATILIVDDDVSIGNMEQEVLTRAGYLTKPFDTKELLARVAVRLRERSSTHGTAFCVGDVALDPTSRTVTVNGKAVALTRTEFAILKLLLQNAGACKILPARPYRRRHAGLYRKLAENSRQPSAR